MFLFFVIQTDICESESQIERNQGRTNVLFWDIVGMK